MAACKKAWLTGSVLVTMALCGPAGAQPDGVSLLALSHFYGEGAFNTVSQVCSQRFPDQAKRWGESLSAWRTRNAALLDEFHGLDAELPAAVKTAPEDAHQPLARS